MLLGSLVLDGWLYSLGLFNQRWGMSRKVTP
jgi:hypothetical protein